MVGIIALLWSYGMGALYLGKKSILIYSPPWPGSTFVNEFGLFVLASWVVAPIKRFISQNSPIQTESEWY